MFWKKIAPDNGLSSAVRGDALSNNCLLPRCSHSIGSDTAPRKLCGRVESSGQVGAVSILRRGWVGVRVEHCYNLGAPPGGGGGNNLNLTFKGSGSTQP